MAKILRQNVGGVNFTMAGCALTGVCPTAAADYIKQITLSDGDVIEDGMMMVVTFANGNSAGNAPNTKTIYSSDQINYYEDDQLTIPFTLAPNGCYNIEYTGTANAYTYTDYPVFQVGSVSGPVCDYRGHITSGDLWNSGDSVQCMFKEGKFLLLGGSGGTDIDVYDSMQDVIADLPNLAEGQLGATKDTGTELSQPVDAVQSGNLHAVTSNAVDEAFGEWVLFENMTSGASVCRIYGKETLKEKYIHIHFEAFLNNTTYSIGNTITVIPEKWRPSETRRAIIDCDLPNGRVGTGVDVYSNGNISLYPQILNQYTGNVLVGGGFYGDATIIVSNF